jgi:hypothetical protein
MDMSSKFMKIGSLFLAGALVSLGPTAHADNINTSGVTCQNYNAGQALDIDYLTNGVRNLNAATRQVICSVSRSPIPLGSQAQFFVDGHNNANTCTTCTLTMYLFGGTVAEIQSFRNCAPATAPLNWDQLVTFTTITPVLDTFDYASLLCTLPGSTNGILYGVTALQP